MKELNKYGNYCIYLRKSRADREAESRGEGETLKKHETALVELAKKMGISISKIYREVVSGETISSRPQMQQLLNDVEDQMWDGVLVMEVERLARGDTKDQGTIAEVFKYSKTKIITPMKTYDPNDEFDEEYFEFGLFMSRREYKTINRRLQRGRMASFNQGKYISSTAPYGYKRVRIKGDSGFTLEIIPEEAKVVKLIYDLYLNGELQTDGSYKRLGKYLIATKLDEMKIKPRTSDKWHSSSIKDILSNPVYAGKVRWGWKPEIRKVENGITRKIRTKIKDYQVVEGLHEAIIDQETFNAVAELFNKNDIPSVSKTRTLKNPLSGLPICGLCGQLMTRRTENKGNRGEILCCPNKYCKNVSAPLWLVEKGLLEGMKHWLNDYKLELSESKNNDQYDESLLELKKISINNIDSEIKSVQAQINKTYDLLEQGIYSIETFTKRNEDLNLRIKQLICAKEDLENKYNTQLKQSKLQHDFIPKVESVILSYPKIENIQYKNELLKSVLDSFTYVKSNPNTKSNPANPNFEIVIKPKLPKGNV